MPLKYSCCTVVCSYVKSLRPQRVFHQRASCHRFFKWSARFYQSHSRARILWSVFFFYSAHSYFSIKVLGHFRSTLTVWLSVSTIKNGSKRWSLRTVDGWDSQLPTASLWGVCSLFSPIMALRSGCWEHARVPQINLEFRVKIKNNSKSLCGARALTSEWVQRHAMEILDRNGSCNRVFKNHSLNSVTKCHLSFKWLTLTFTISNQDFFIFAFTSGSFGRVKTVERNVSSDICVQTEQKPEEWHVLFELFHLEVLGMWKTPTDWKCGDQFCNSQSKMTSAMS